MLVSQQKAAARKNATGGKDYCLVTWWGLSPEAWIILALGLADLVSTLLLLRAGVAVEGNPVLRPFAARSPFALIAAKLLLTVPAILLVEMIRRDYEATVRLLERSAIVGYALIYLCGSFLCRA